MDMFWVWMNPIGGENVPKEGKLSFPELALAKLELEILGVQTSESLAQQRVMLLNCFSIDEDVVNVDSHTLQISRGLVDELLTNSSRIDQPEWNPSVLTKPQQHKRCSESSAVSMQLNVVKHLHEIQLGEELRTPSLLEYIHWH